MAEPAVTLMPRWQEWLGTNRPWSEIYFTQTDWDIFAYVSRWNQSPFTFASSSSFILSLTILVIARLLLTLLRRLWYPLLIQPSDGLCYSLSLSDAWPRGNALSAVCPLMPAFTFFFFLLLHFFFLFDEWLCTSNEEWPVILLSSLKRLCILLVFSSYFFSLFSFTVASSTVSCIMHYLFSVSLNWLGLWLCSDGARQKSFNYLWVQQE